MSHTINNTRGNSNKSKVWIYFKKCDGDSKKARCNLCSLELTNNGTTTALWNHIKSKHAIERSTPNHDIPSDESNMTIPTKIRANSNNSNNFNNGNSNNKSTSNNNSNNTNCNSTSKSLRKNLDFITTEDDSLLTSMKPLPSSSISKNLISRLNQLSSPVIRKLKFWNKKSFQVNQYDPNFKVIYLGNLAMQLWSKDESCLDKPLGTLWNNYLVNMKTEIVMRLTICNSGLKAITRQHGLTQYWSNRLVYCCSHKNYPRIFSWVYRHEGKKMRQELRCHAVFCPSPEKATKMVTLLNQRLACALQEFRREKKSRSHSLVSNNSHTSNASLALQQKLPQTIPLRRQILAKGSANFRPPLERSKSAPKLTSILEEDGDDDEDDEEHYVHSHYNHQNVSGNDVDDDDDGQEEDEDEDGNADDLGESQDELEFAESFGDRDDDDEEYNVDEDQDKDHREPTPKDEKEGEHNSKGQIKI